MRNGCGSSWLARHSSGTRLPVSTVRPLLSCPLSSKAAFAEPAPGAPGATRAARSSGSVGADLTGQQPSTAAKPSDAATATVATVAAGAAVPSDATVATNP